MTSFCLVDSCIFYVRPRKVSPIPWKRLLRYMRSLENYYVRWSFALQHCSTNTRFREKDTFFETPSSRFSVEQSFERFNLFKGVTDCIFPPKESG